MRRRRAFGERGIVEQDKCEYRGNLRDFESRRAAVMAVDVKIDRLFWVECSDTEFSSTMLDRDDVFLLKYNEEESHFGLLYFV